MEKTLPFGRRDWWRTRFTACARPRRYDRGINRIEQIDQRSARVSRRIHNPYRHRLLRPIRWSVAVARLAILLLDPASKDSQGRIDMRRSLVIEGESEGGLVHVPVAFESHSTSCPWAKDNHEARVVHGVLLPVDLR